LFLTVAGIPVSSANFCVVTKGICGAIAIFGIMVNNPIFKLIDVYWCLLSIRFVMFFGLS
jgi:hypothetical protein